MNNKIDLFLGKEDKKIWKSLVGVGPTKHRLKIDGG